ncbi:uncharacterized protein (TIGR00369 family) [Neomicrococcus aestuarii]|uniref:Uncharacterized protein (TIGR00369 family) n=1 Tax=Neomicrococcus aestuarii TaxID=556325 RepID=A0A7W8X0J8_9MICC|nr:hotdog fold thioesterase [Neomicrococcus aestuarii]MBB5511789.1 uncharacterized protein (TIGR00369 family) [Neomicrococcus aestuarii]
MSQNHTTASASNESSDSRHTSAAETPLSTTTEHPFADQLTRAGVPEELWGPFGKFGVGPLVEKLGIVFTEMSARRLVATMPVEGNTQVAGILHGGASAALAETLGSFGAALHSFEQGLGKRPVGVDLNSTHHRAGVSGLVTAVCTPIFLGSRITTHEIIMSDDQGKRLCTSRITNMLVE